MERLIEQFIDRYLPRDEIIHRLPVSMPISRFWPELQKARRERGIVLPLCDQAGQSFWFVLNASIEKQCDRIVEIAQHDVAFCGVESKKMFEDAVIDEAIYSSMIEGAFTTREAAIRFIKKKQEPANKSEHMVKNNYDALTYVLEHLEDEITEETIVTIARIVTRDAAEEQVTGYRGGGVVVTSRDEIVYTPPAWDTVPSMMKSLVLFINNSELHPILKACIAHFYFVYVHPFGDGNGRTARALSYMMLLQAGYDFFRYFSISGIVANERGKYYRSIANAENPDSDMTYFIDCYSDMLSRTASETEDHLIHHVLVEKRVMELSRQSGLNERQLKGARWLLTGASESVTVEAWKKKFKVVTETARRDLLTLCEHGVLCRTQIRRKAVFRIIRQ